MVDESATGVEQALRWLATRKTARPFESLLNAFEDPLGEPAEKLRVLISPVPWPSAMTAKSRALVLWGLIVHLIGRIGSSADSRRRNALAAAFRLPRRPELAQPWKRTLEARFQQLKPLEQVYGSPPPTTTTPMHKAWNSAVRNNLAPAFAANVRALAIGEVEWKRYEAVGESTERSQTDLQQPTLGNGALRQGFRPPSEGAQPLLALLFVTNVFMRRRTVYRRITERLVVAMEPNVDGYMARALAGTAASHASLPVVPLWGCTAEHHPVTSPPGEPVMTKLRFPKALQLNERHHFASETINEESQDARLWVNVEVDHYGIVPGSLHEGQVPISGLTIRIRFDDSCLPKACWSYAEQTERQRRIQPPPGDPRWLRLDGNTVRCTFEQKCQPQGSYGVSILWPTS